MKILVLTGLYPPYYKGGHEISVKFIADGLAKRGHDLAVLTSSYGIGENRPQEGGVFRLLRHLETIPVPGVRNRYNQVCNGIKGRLNYHTTRKVLARFPAEIVFVGQVENVSVLTLKAVQDEGLPMVHHVGAFDLPLLESSLRNEKSALKRLYRRVTTGFDGMKNFDLRYLIAVSDSVRSVYAAAGLSPADISIIPPLGVAAEGIVRQWPAPPRPAGPTLQLLYVGRLVEEKGIHVALESLRHLKEMSPGLDIRLDVIGNGDPGYLERLKQLSAGPLSGIATVVFKKGMAREEVLSQYRNYDMLLVPSTWQEPFGLIILEAMSQGVPVVASRVGGIPEIIEDGESGLLVPPGDPLMLAEAIKRLVDEPPLRERIIDNGIKTVEGRFTEGKILDQMEAYLRRALLDYR
jgi:glycogen synthase